ncbi:outer membrane beta-barrel protein [Spongiimicrobium salis]|uniref:outer membrane beta-barrel protein n=1 Tax=Spongiimicrobium salis TaxID=1667022 RepID=UPI00374D71A7
MIQKLLLAATLFISLNILAQDDSKKWSVALNYPLSDELNSTGIFDLGVKYRFVDFNFVRLGASLNGGLFLDESNDPSFDFNRQLYYIQPKVFGEFIIPGLKKLRPFAGIGYSRFTQRISGLLGSPQTTVEDGFGANLGLTYDFGKNWFITAQYDYTNVKQRGLDLNRFNTSIDLVKVGIGIRF